MHSFGSVSFSRCASLVTTSRNNAPKSGRGGRQMFKRLETETGVCSEIFPHALFKGGVIPMTDEHLQRIVEALGGWPEHMNDLARRHGLSILAQLAREKFVDEGVFGMIVRYGVHRAAFDELSEDISKEEFSASADKFLSGKSQQRAYHENNLAKLEKSLLATPYERVKSGGVAQTSFLTLLDQGPQDPDGTTATGASQTVTPFRPLTRRTYK